MARVVAMALFVALWGGLLPSTFAEGEKTLKARLSVMPLDDAARFVGQSSVTGSGSVTATLKGQELSLTGTFEGMQSPATVARLHSGAKPGIRGPALFDLTVTSATGGRLSGVLNLSAQQVTALGKGRFYLQIHSENAADGNLWGWLIPSGGLPPDEP